VRQDAADKYTVVATVATMAGAKTISVDPVSTSRTCIQRSMVRRLPTRRRHSRGRVRRAAPSSGAWFFAISH